MYVQLAKGTRPKFGKKKKREKRLRAPKTAEDGFPPSGEESRYHPHGKKKLKGLKARKKKQWEGSALYLGNLGI